MTMKWWKTGLVVFAVLGVCTSFATANVAVTLGQVGWGGVDEVTVGWEFKLAGDITVTHLGLWLLPGDACTGFRTAHPIAIWNKADPADPCVAGTIPAGTEDGVVGDYLYIPVTNVTLPAYTSAGVPISYVIGVLWPTGNIDDPFINWASGYTIDPFLTIVNKIVYGNAYNSRIAYGSGLIMPSGASNNLWSPNFQFETNKPPVADAGVDATVKSADQAVTIIQGTASDPDGDALQYQWLEGTNVLKGWTAVGADGVVTLDLGAISTFTLGVHTLTLEVSDSKATSSDTVVLTVENTPPAVIVNPPSQTVELNVDAIIITGTVADFDADSLSYRWLKGAEVLRSGVVNPPVDGGPYDLLDLTIPAGDSGFPLGTHAVTLEVDDGTNPVVVKTAEVIVKDEQVPTLAPTASTSMLWPPDHTLRPVSINAYAVDNSGGTITLGVTVQCNENPATAEPDWYVDSVDNATGTILLRLRATRLGKGDGRIYTVTIVATDPSGNQSNSAVNICVPHDRRK